MLSDLDKWGCGPGFAAGRVLGWMGGRVTRVFPDAQSPRRPRDFLGAEELEELGVSAVVIVVAVASSFFC